MALNNLKPAAGSVKGAGKRLGRGQGSGKGGTASRGHNGQKSRSGYSRKIGFEGGQMPLQRRVPKFGFTNINRKDYVGVNLDKLQGLVENGKITDTRVYGRVLTDEEIFILYKHGLTNTGMQASKNGTLYTNREINEGL